MNASSSTSSDKRNRHKGASKENEYKKGSRPILWLSPNFLLQTEELLRLLDILANKVKAIRRLRELLTTKLPMGTFPVKEERYLLQFFQAYGKMIGASWPIAACFIS